MKPKNDTKSQHSHSVGATKSLSRRNFIKGSTAAAAGFSFPFLNTRSFAQSAPVELTMLAWNGHAEKDIVAEFERANNVRIRPKYYVGGDNMLALLTQSPPGTYDLILSDAEYVQQLIATNSVETLDPADYPFGDFYPEFQKFQGHWKDGRLYSVITRFGLLGVAYNTQAVSEKEARSYNIYFSPKYKGKVGHFDWHLPNLGQISMMNGNRDPYNISANAWRAVQEKTLSLRSNVGGFFDYGGAFSSLRSGQIVVMAGIGDWITGVLRKNGAPLKTVIPDEGGLQFTESFSIGKGSKKQDLAKQFIRYITSPEGQVRSAMMKAYPAVVPSRKAWDLMNKLHPEEAKQLNMALNQHNALDEIRTGRVALRQLPKQQALEDWADFWSQYKNA